MRRAVVPLPALAAVVLSANVCWSAGAAGWHVTYRAPFYTRRSDASLKANEAWARKGGHMPWRRYAVYVASVDAVDMVPLQVRMKAGVGSTMRLDTPRRVVRDRVEWTLAAQHHGKALVRVTARGRAVGEVRLAQPFGWWWYVTSARRVGVKKSPIVVLYPDGTREYLPGPLRFVGRQAYLPAQDLVRVQLGVKWDAGRKALEVYTPQSDNALWFRVGQRWAEGFTASEREPLAWAPLRERGRILLPAESMARQFHGFMPAWKPRSRVLELRVVPFAGAGGT